MVILWDAATQKMIGEPRAGHLGAVNSVAFSPDGKLLVSGSNDGTLILWDVESHQKIGQIYTDSLNQINNVVFHPSGRMFASGSKDGLIGLWSLDAQEWIKDACRLVTRNMTPKEWELYFPREEYRNTCAK
jgi:WD40 repeat protein